MESSGVSRIMVATGWRSQSPISRQHASRFEEKRREWPLPILATVGSWYIAPVQHFRSGPCSSLSRSGDLRMAYDLDGRAPTAGSALLRAS